MIWNNLWKHFNEQSEKKNTYYESVNINDVWVSPLWHIQKFIYLWKVVAIKIQLDEIILMAIECYFLILLFLSIVQFEIVSPIQNLYFSCLQGQNNINWNLFIKTFLIEQSNIKNHLGCDKGHNASLHYSKS